MYISIQTPLINATAEIKLDFVDVSFYAPDLVIYRYHPNIHLTWEMVVELANQTNAMIGYKPCYMCAVIGQGLTIEKEVREKGSTPEMLRYTKASAIVQNSLAHRILANFIIRVQRPIVPTRSFSKVEDAIAWFDHFKDLEKREKGSLLRTL